MSEPSYRITTEHDPLQSEGVWWTARVVRLSDGVPLKAVYAETEEHALERACDVIRALSNPKQAGHVYLATEDGELDPAPQASGTPVRA